MILLVYVTTASVISPILWNYKASKQFNNLTEKIDVIEDALYIPDHSLGEPIDLETVAYLLLKHGAIQPEIGLKQAILESGFDLNSNVSRNSRNIFGIRYFKNRTSTAIGSDRSGYNIYNTYEDCIIDFCNIQKNAYNHIDKDDYFKSLDRYAEDPQYHIKLKNIRL